MSKDINPTIQDEKRIELMNELARRVRLYIGSRTLTDFAKDTDLSLAYLSRLSNGRLKKLPLRKTLQKFGAVEPQNGIKIDDLLELVDNQEYYINEEHDVKAEDFTSQAMKYYNNVYPSMYGIFRGILKQRGIGLHNFSVEDCEEDEGYIMIDCYEDLADGVYIALNGFCRFGDAKQKTMAVFSQLFRLASMYAEKNIRPHYFVIGDNEEFCRMMELIQVDNVDVYCTADYIQAKLWE